MSKLLKDVHGFAAPLETQTKGDQTVFNETSYLLRKAIVQELASGTPISDITVDMGTVHQPPTLFKKSFASLGKDMR